MSGLICLALPVFALTAYLGWMYWKERQFAQHLYSVGESTSAIIVERFTEPAGRAGNICSISYQFKVQAGGETITQTQRQQVTSKAFKRLKEGERVPIRYLAEDPNTSRLDGEYRDRSKARSQLAMFGFCVVLSILFVVAMLRQ